ncbi:LacI family DNA-binding transcriptional regulator [Subtercola boreus]|uniref:Uncharacterized protein n=1 Tax=Subtercola boreus TaxID=120213 RepID=A0A3E0W8G9_9MICO|nr:LacI family DNA-binding transcriptional regulator [Subtercola boreus]RFA18119.1 hypothetical protein B7R24_15855 [Subtercola boreus]RFA18501.1 hypothetical protein B7R23_15890 [Subtercola boreus]RFA25029.1 hypothetical protein B7R25_15885 [Subtercola boreus]
MEEPEARALNIRDVAREAGVSYQTVSRVLNGSTRVSESTRQHVQAFVDRLGYSPNRTARALSTSRSRTIGVLAAPSALMGPGTALTAIEMAARDAGYSLSITNLRSNDPADVRSSIDYLRGHAVEALIVLVPQERALAALSSLNLEIPLVTLGSGGEPNVLVMDQIAGARAAVAHLAELGHREIVHIAGPHSWVLAEARIDGYIEELSARGLPVHTPLAGDWTAASGYAAGLSSLAERRFTGVFAGSDSMALGFMRACREFGVQIPRDISVVGFDDFPEAQFFTPPLTTIHQDFSELGRRTIFFLLARLRGEEYDERPILPRLVVRESTAAPLDR